MGTVSHVLQEFCLNADLESETRLQLLKHITTKYFRTKTTSFADLDRGGVPMSSELEQVLAKKFPVTLKKAIILRQSPSRRIPTLKIEGPMTNKISVIKELGVLTHMPDGDSLTVRGYLIRLRKGLIEYRFLTKSSIWRVRNIVCRCNGLFLIDMPHWRCSPGNVRPGTFHITCL